jgi:hypothetical protein
MNVCIYVCMYVCMYVCIVLMITLSNKRERVRLKVTDFVRNVESAGFHFPKLHPVPPNGFLVLVPGCALCEPAY